MAMDTTDTSDETLLVIRLSTPKPLAGLAPVDDRQRDLDAAKAAIQSQLAASGDCMASRINGELICALFTAGDAAFAAANALQQAAFATERRAPAVRLRLLLDRPDPAEMDAGQTASLTVSARQGQLVRQLPPDWLHATAAVMPCLQDGLRARFRRYEEDAGTDTVLMTGLYRALLNEDATTRIALPGQLAVPEGDRRSRSLSLRWRNRTLTLRRDSQPLTLGRSEQADIQIESELVSRIHASVAFRETDFILTDQSTNGTFVQIGDLAEVALHHEQIVLRDNGIIGLGQRVCHGRGKLIYFRMLHT